MKNSFNVILFVSLFALLSCSGQRPDDETGDAVVFFCNAEEIDSTRMQFTEANGKALYFQNTSRRSGEASFSGNYSCKLTPDAPYGFTTELTNIKADDYLGVTAWRKSRPASEGVIVIDGGESFYNAGKFIVENRDDGWQKIFLEAFVPPNFNSGKVKIYVWNNSTDSVYFDDLRIVHRNTKVYPEINPLNAMQMYIDDIDFDRLNKQRFVAFETGVLMNSGDDYSNTVLFDGSDFLNAEYRLKGDLVDHLQGEKWSFRIKLKDDFSWKNMRTFSVQNPSTRSFLQEWLAHKIFEQEDVLTTRYGFVPLRLNNRSLGIYAWEEHFEKQLIESRARREGPIVRFDETLYWQHIAETNITGTAWNIDYFGAAPVIPFKEGKTTSDSLLLNELVDAQKLMLAYKNMTHPVSGIFNVDKLAQYYALIDVTQAYHGFTWHNQRFYFNPVTCLLEPIAFDGYIEDGIYKRFEEQISGMISPQKTRVLPKEEFILFQAFKDTVFNQKYLEYLERYSSEEFINGLVSTYESEIDSLSSLIQIEYPYYQFNFGYITDQAQWIRENLTKVRQNLQELSKTLKKINSEKFNREYTSEVNSELIPLMVHAYFDEEKKQLDILNFHNGEIAITGVFIEDRLPKRFESTPVLQPYKGTESRMISVVLDDTPERVLFAVDDEFYETTVHPWKYSTELPARQNIALESSQNLPLEGDKIIFRGNYSFDEDIVIPATKQVVFMPGTTLDLINGAGFFSWTGLQINGTADSPVRIFSSDHSAQGINVLGAQNRSKITYAEFSGLSSLQRGGWQSPAAVNFYESDVDFENCIFASNINCDDALNVVRSDFNLTDCRFEYTFADAFDSDFSTGTVENCVFRNTGNDAIDFSGSVVDILNCEMTTISDKAISGGEKTVLKVTDCTIDNANIGIASKDLSVVELNNIEMNRTKYSLAAFKKKAEFGPAVIDIENLKVSDNSIFHQIEEGSVLYLNGKTIHGREKDLASKLYQ